MCTFQHPDYRHKRDGIGGQGSRSNKQLYENISSTIKHELKDLILKKLTYMIDINKNITLTQGQGLKVKVQDLTCSF